MSIMDDELNAADNRIRQQQSEYSGDFQTTPLTLADDLTRAMSEAEATARQKAIDLINPTTYFQGLKDTYDILKKTVVPNSWWGASPQTVVKSAQNVLAEKGVSSATSAGAKAIAFTGKALMTPFELYGNLQDEIEAKTRGSINEMIKWNLNMTGEKEKAGFISPDTTGPELASILYGAAQPSYTDIIKVDPVPYKASGTIVPSSSPDAIPVAVQRHPDALKEIGMFLTGGAHKIASMAPGFALDTQVLKGMGTLARTKAGQEILSSLANDLFNAMPSEVQKGLRVGVYDLPEAAKEPFIQRAIDIRRLEEMGHVPEASQFVLTDAERKRVGQILANQEVITRKKGTGIFSDLFPEKFNEPIPGTVSFGDINVRGKKYVEGVGVVKAPQAPGLEDATGLTTTELRTKASLTRHYFDFLSEKISTLNDAAKAAGSPFVADQMAEIIKANVGSFLPLRYAVFEKPLEAGKIPSSFFAKLWDLNGEQLKAIEAMSPAGAERLMDTVRRASEGLTADVSGFKPLRVRSGSFNNRMETVRANQLLEDYSIEQSKLKDEAAKALNWENIGINSEVYQALLSRNRIDIPYLASQDYTQPGGLTKIQAELSKALGFNVSQDRAASWVSKAQEAMRTRNQLEGKWGTLESKKRNVDFFAKAKTGVEDSVDTLANWQGDMNALAKHIEGYLARPVTDIEAMDMQQKALAYKAGKLPFDGLGAIKDMTFDMDHFKAALGPLNDPLVQIARTQHSLANAVANMQLFNTIAVNPEWTLPQEAAAKAGYTLMPDTRALGPLAGRYVNAGIANEINTMMTFRDNFQKLGWKLMSLWKMGKVVFSPATRFRNMTTNSVVGDFLGMSHLQQAMDIPFVSNQLRNRTGIYKKAVKDGALLGNFSDSELNAFTDDIVAKLGSDKPADLWTSFINAAGRMASPVASHYQTEEELWKLMAYNHLTTRVGLDGKEAATLVNRYFFNYDDVAPWVKYLRSNPGAFSAPFLTYQMKILPLLAHVLTTNPMKVLKYEMMFRAIDEGSAAVRGVSPDRLDQEKKLALKDAPAFTRAITLPFENSRGDPYMLDTTFNMPWGNIVDSNDLFGVPGTFTVGGLVRPMLELGFNRSFWSGKPIWGKEFTQVKDIAPLLSTMAKDDEETAFKRGIMIGQEMMDHLIKSYAPSLAGVPFVGSEVGIGGFGYQRLVRSLNKQTATPASTEPQPVEQAVLDTVFGLKIRAEDSAQNMNFQINHLAAQRDAAKGQIKALAIQAENGFIKKPEFDAKMQILSKEMELIGQEMDKIYAETEKNGIDVWK